MSLDRKNSRTYNSIVNSLVGIAVSIITVLLNFFVRIVIVHQLGEEINGIHSLFQSITNTIALIEAGFSTAMVIHLYKPVAENNEEETRAILRFYKRIYLIIALVFLLICVVINAFFIEHIVKSTIPISRVRLYFSIYMLITPVTYLTYYKVSILYAEQKNRIRFISTAISQVIFRVLQMVSVFVFHEYYVFLILMIFEQVCNNYICTAYVNKNHPGLKKKASREISQETKKSIFKTVGPIFVNNIAINTQSSAKGILIGLLVPSVSIVGYFGNYQLVFSTAQLLFSQFGGAFTSSFGNLAVDKDKDYMYNVYRKVSFIMCWIAITVCAGFICCIDPFILMCFGESFLLGRLFVCIMSFELLVNLLNVPIYSIQNALGLHRYDQKQMIIQAVLSLILGYLMGRTFGLVGVLVGLLLPQFCFTLIYKGIVINRVAFGRKTGDFIKLISGELLKGMLVITVCYAVSGLISTGVTVLDFLLRGVAALVISLVMFFALSFKNRYYAETIAMVKTMFRR